MTVTRITSVGLCQFLVFRLPSLPDVVGGLGADLAGEGGDLAGLLDVLLSHAVTGEARVLRGSKNKMIK